MSAPARLSHIGNQDGGYLRPHHSHQSGRDADVGYYYKGGPRSFVRASEENLDLPRTWALVKAAIKETTVEMILIDRSVQRILAVHYPDADDRLRAVVARAVVLVGDGLLREAFRLNELGDPDVLAEGKQVLGAYIAARLR